MNETVKVVLMIIAAIVLLIIIILFLLGRKRIKQEEATDDKLDQLIKDGKYVKAKCIIQSDIIYHERVALDDSQREHLKYYDSLIQTCDKNINEKNIDEKQELANYINEVIPKTDYADFTFTLKYCKPHIDLQNASGETFLMTAIKHNRVDIASHLLDQKINVNKKNNQGKTALIIACELGSGEFVSLLLKNGADVQLRDNSGKNIIKLVNTDSDDFTTIVSLLVESGANKDD